MRPPAGACTGREAQRLDGTWVPVSGPIQVSTVMRRAEHRWERIDRYERCRVCNAVRVVVYP